MNEGARHTINPSKIMEHVIFNTLMRAVGFVIRFVTIGVGLVATVCVIIGGVGMILTWLVLPLALAGLIFVGITFILKPI